MEQLGTLALGIPGYEGKVLDECYLVTNGEISELVSQQIQLLNASLVQRGHPAEKIKTITRGTLLAWSIDLGLALWPSEMEDFGNLVKLLNFQGDEIFPSKIFDPLLQHTLRLHETVPAPEYFSVSRVLLGSEVPAQDVRPSIQSYRRGARRRVEGWASVGARRC